MPATLRRITLASRLTLKLPLPCRMLSRATLPTCTTTSTGFELLIANTNRDIVSAMPKCFLISRLVLFAAIAAMTLSAESRPVSVNSPDGQLVISFETVHESSTSREAGQLVYSVTYRGKPLITQSALKLELGARPLGSNVQIVNQTASQVDETYRLVTGKTSLVRNHYN